jgi:hypothetical protein
MISLDIMGDGAAKSAYFKPFTISNPSVSGAVGLGWSPLRNLEKRIIKERIIGGWC